MLDPLLCEKARLARDPRFDGLFFTGVLSTGIFCRPICPAPQPKQANVVYFPTAAAAAESGLRPCLRCRPEAAPGTPAWNGTSATVARAMHLIRQGALNDGGVETLAARLGLGGRQLRRLFKQHIGASPVTVGMTQRVFFAKKLLAETGMSVTEIAFACGFGSPRRFNAAFAKVYRQSPSAFRRQTSQIFSGGAFECTLALPFRPKLDWRRILDFYRQRAIAGVEVVEGDSYRRAIACQGGSGLIQVRPSATGQALDLHVILPDSRGLMPVVERVRRMFDLDANLPAIREHLSVDGLLAPLVERLDGMRLPCAWDSFETAVRAIVGQQVSVKAALGILGRIVRAAGTKLSEPCHGLTHCFPSPEAIAETDLRGLGLTSRRERNLGELARAIQGDPTLLDVRDDLDTFIRRLTALPGIGPWTAHYIALRGLGEPDAFPAGDLGLAKALSCNGIRPGQKQILQMAEAWRPWRGYAAIYLWNR